MIQITPKIKIEYGDFQTPIALADNVCRKLLELGVSPDIIIEPTCGIGNFIQASAKAFQQVDKILGFEINQNYLQAIQNNRHFTQDQRIQFWQGDFFTFDWDALLKKYSDSAEILVLGNFPWVTNSQQGAIEGKNLPQKTNFQNHTGLEAMTGKSNFDISEWMLIHSIQGLQKRNASLAMLCKTSVARKILNYIRSKNLNLAYCATYKIDARKYFDATVDACLLFCKFDASSRHYFCDVFSSLESDSCYRIGYRNNIAVRDTIAFDQLTDLYNPIKGETWRSGIKHDCSNVMEIRRVSDSLINGFGEVLDIEDTYLFPLAKGSDVAQDRLDHVNRYVLVTQKYPGESTGEIQKIAPKTWSYLQAHAQSLDNRKSKIYQKSSRFSIFGVGSYTFSPWKIAICGLYKKLDFRLVGTIEGRSVAFDDTVYFLSFADRQSACQALALLTSPPAIAFYSSLIFWDEKRPIKSSILNSLSLAAVATRLAQSFED
jgi:hypothetical protein